MSGSELPPPSAALSVIKMLVLAWFLLQPAEVQAKFVKALRLVATIFQGPVRGWPLDFGRPLSQAEDVIAENRRGAAWIDRYAELLEVFSRAL